MKNLFKLIFTASKSVLSESRGYRFWFTGFTIVASVLFILVPVWSVPGNTIPFQLSLFTMQNWILFTVLAPLIALLLTMQVFVFRRAKSAATRARNLSSGAGTAAGAYAGLLGAVFATAACSWCVAALFGFLGTGAVLFIVQNQVWAVLVAVGIMLVSLYFASNKVIKECDCEPVKT